MKRLPRIAGIAAVMVATIIAASAQDRIQILVGGVISEIKNPFEIVRNSRTLNIDGKVNVIDKSGWTFGPAFNFQRAYDVEVVPDSEIYPHGIYRDVNTCFGGVEVAKKAGPFKFGGGFFLGRRRLMEGMDYQLVRKYRGFVEIASGHFVVRPFFAEAEVSGGFNANRIHRYGAAGGLRF